VAKKSVKWKLNLYFFSQRRVKTFFLVVAMVAMLCWHWQLLLATLSGVLIMRAIYLAPHWNWQIIKHYWEYIQESSNRQFSLAVCGGTMGSLIVYYFSSLLVKSENPWLASSIILQTLLSLFTLTFLVGQFLTRKKNQQLSQWEESLNNLTSLNPLKRLIAVRQLHDLAEKKQLNPSQLQQLREYFQLMMLVETEPLIKQVISTSLETNFPVSLNIPLQIPSLKLKKSFFSHY
jgi:hypothetical protein